MVDRIRLLYLAIAIVAVAVLAYAYTSLNPVYSVGVAISQLNPRAQTYPYQTAFMRITLENRAHTYIRNLPVDTYINGRLFNSYTVSIPPSSSAVINTNYTFRSSGNYSFDAVADPAHVVDIVNRSAAQSGFTVNVLAPTHPNVYTAIPNNNINYTEAFSIFTPGVGQLDALGKVYNLTMANNFNGGSSNGEISAVYSNLLPYTREINGAYVSYSNGTRSYVSWMQGDLSPAMVDIILRSFRVAITNTTTANSTVTMARVNNATSLCVLYSGGWTKIISYTNSTSSLGSCQSFVGRNYTPSESNVLSAQLKSNTTLFNDKGRFLYTNSSQTGFIIEKSPTGIAVSNLFQNSYGLFMTYLKENREPVSAPAQLICRGLIYNQTKNMSVCSVYQIPQSAANLSLINTTELTPSYHIGIYSLVNGTNAVSAHINGADLIYSLNISQQPFPWESPFKDSCALLNSSIGCNVIGLNQSSSTAYLRISNGYNSTIGLTSASCFMAGLSSANPLKSAIAPQASANISVHCTSPPVPLASVQQQFSLVLNYTTANNVSRTVSGYLNMTS